MPLVLQSSLRGKIKNKKNNLKQSDKIHNIYIL